MHFIKRHTGLALFCLLFLSPGILVLAGEPAPHPREKSVPPLFLQKQTTEGQPTVVAPPALVGPKDGKAAFMAELKVTGVPKGTAVLWRVSYKAVTKDGLTVYVDAADVQKRVIKSEYTLLFSGPKGEYKVVCDLVKGEDSTPLEWLGELTAGLPPTPAPPGPPGPPVPPSPEPQPKSENPFGAQPGLRIMIVYETMDDAKRPSGEYLILRGQKFRDYLDSNCVSDGYRMVDQNSKTIDTNAWYASALKRTDRKSLTWLYVGKEATGMSIPLPKDSDATIAEINKFLGK